MLVGYTAALLTVKKKVVCLVAQEDGRTRSRLGSRITRAQAKQSSRGLPHGRYGSFLALALAYQQRTLPQLLPASFRGRMSTSKLCFPRFSVSEFFNTQSQFAYKQNPGNSANIQSFRANKALVLQQGLLFLPATFTS